MRARRKTATAKWRPKHTSGEMNGAERRYAVNELEARRLAGEIVGYEFEKLRLRIGVGAKGEGTGGKAAAWFTPDFVVFRTDGFIELVDVKGSGPGEEAAHVRIRAAAQQYPQFIWVLAQEIKGKPGRFNRVEFDQPD